jgi:glycine C-acetyltransferase
VLQSHPDIINAAQAALEKYGTGLSSVRFICGTQDIHKVSVSNFEHNSSYVYP